MGGKHPGTLTMPLLLVLVCLADSIPAVQARGETSPGPSPPPAARTDSGNDPLPAGAVARLGSTRFRCAGAIEDLVFGPEDKTLLAYWGRQLVVWDRSTGKRSRRFDLPAELPASFSPDGKALALVDREQVHIFDTANGKELLRLPRPEKGDFFSDLVRPVFSPDGRKLAVAGKKVVVLHDRTNGKTLTTFEGVRDARVLAFSPDSRWLAVLPHYSPVQLWDVIGRKRVHDFSEGKDIFGEAALCFSRDGKRLAWGGLRTLTVAEVATRKIVSQFEDYFYTSSLAFTADGRGLLVGGTSAGLQLRDLTLGKKTRDLSRFPSGKPVLALSRDSKTLATGDNYGIYRQVRLYDLATNKRQHVEEGQELYPRFLAFSPDGKSLATGDEASVLFWDARTGKLHRRLQNVHKYGSVLSADLNRLARLWVRKVEFWDLASGKPAPELNYKGEDCINLAAFSSDGRQLISAHNKNYPNPNPGRNVGHGKNGLHVWDLASGKMVRSLTTERECFFVSLILTPDGHTAVTATAGGYISTQEGESSITSREYSKGGPLHVWDLRAGQQGLILEGHEGSAPGLTVSADGRLLASAGYDKTVRLWELASGQTVFTIPNGGKWSQPAALSPDGHLLAVAARPGDGETSGVAFWDVASGKEVYQFRGLRADFHLLEFSPDGSRLATALEDGTVLLWDLTPVRRVAVRPPVKLREGDSARLWADLGSLDARRAHQVIWRLIDAGDEAVALLRQRVGSAKADPRRLSELIAALDGAKFAARNAATRELAELGELAEPALRQALKSKPSLEVRQRLEGILVARWLANNAGTLRRLRAVRVLEKIATPEARKLLRILARGDADVRSTQEAVAALKRLQ